MLLDRFSWDSRRVIEMYKHSVEKRQRLGLAEIKRDMIENDLNISTLPHADRVKQVIAANGSTSTDKPSSIARTAGAASSTIVDGKTVAYGDVIGCYEMRYGHGVRRAPPSDIPTATPRYILTGAQHWQNNAKAATEPDAVSPEEFTRYMLYVTQWRWLQCERYIHRHGQLGFWSIVHDISCPVRAKLRLFRRRVDARKALTRRAAPAGRRATTRFGAACDHC